MTAVRQSLLAGLALGVACAVEPVAVQGTSVEELVAQGETLLDEGKARRAAAVFEEADRLARGAHVGALLGLSRAQQEMEDFERSVAAAERGLAVADTDERRIEAYKRLGLARFGRRGRDLEPAAEAFRQALGLSDQPEAATHYNLAVVLRELGRAEEALEEARRVVAAEAASPTGDRARILICALRPPPEVGETRVESEDAARGEGATPDEVKAPVLIHRGEFPPGWPGLGASELLGVVVQSIIDEEGCIVDPKVVGAHKPRIDRAAVDYVRDLVFRPATRESEPVAVHYTLTISLGWPR